MFKICIMNKEHVKTSKSILTFYKLLDLCHFPLKIIPYKNIHCRSPKILFVNKIQICVFSLWILCNLKIIFLCLINILNVLILNIIIICVIKSKRDKWDTLRKRDPLFLELNMYWKFCVTEFNDFIERTEMF